MRVTQNGYQMEEYLLKLNQNVDVLFQKKY